MYASILSKAIGKTPAECMTDYMTRRRYFDVKSAIDEGVIDKASSCS
jgi:ATP-dependent protease ClpP protease subunit